MYVARSMILVRFCYCSFRFLCLQGRRHESCNSVHCKGILLDPVVYVNMHIGLRNDPCHTRTV